MKIALINAKRSRTNVKTQTAVNFRNMLEIQDYIGADGLYDVYDVKAAMNKNYDAFLFGFGSQSNDFEETVKLLNKNPKARVFWLVGEYEQTNYWAILKANRRFTVIKNFEGSGKLAKKSLVDAYHDVNINLLISQPPNPIGKKKYDCVYYSRWRPDREKYLQRYLKGNTYFSTDAKNFKQHKHIGCSPKWIKKLSWNKRAETLNLFRYSLYIEDEYTHKVFNNLANRWYEAGICNNVTFFDASCRNTIEKSEIGYYMEQIEFYLVSSYDELQEKIKICNKDFEKHLATQKLWRMNEQLNRAEVLKRIKEILTS